MTAFLSLSKKKHARVYLQMDDSEKMEKQNGSNVTEESDMESEENKRASERERREKQLIIFKFFTSCEH